MRRLRAEVVLIPWFFVTICLTILRHLFLDAVGRTNAFSNCVFRLSKLGERSSRFCEMFVRKSLRKEWDRAGKRTVANALPKPINNRVRCRFEIQLIQ